ncbi:Crp/Fnr family transcriptional regulator [Ureibacillus composti]
MMDNRPTNFYQLFKDHGLLMKVEKNHHIFHEGEKANDLFFIQCGIVQISKETENGKELTVRVCSKASLIGETDLFNQFNKQNHTTSAKALSYTEVLTISKQSIEMFLTEQPALMIEYLKFLQNDNLKKQSQLRDLLMNGKKGAIISTLIRLANTFGEEVEANKININYHITNTEIANLSATTREAVNRLLNDLKTQEIISLDKGLITINDFQFLKDEICCEDCPISVCRID